MKVSIQHKYGPRLVDLNRRKAIRERCLNCVAWERGRVKTCEFEGDCHLWPYRMWTGKQDAKARAKAIRDYCLWCMCGQRSEIAKCTCPDCPLYAYRSTRVDRSVELAPSVSKMAIYAPKTDLKRKRGVMVRART